jgi:Protein of unknown function (DUF1549)/Planctomycete cytochrome C
MWKSATGWLGLAVLMGTGAAAAADPTEFFETRVRPVLANNCYSCHANSESGGLRLDSRERVLKGGKSGAAVVPGKPDESLLIRAIRQVDSRLKMPLGGKLRDEEITDLTKWVELGCLGRPRQAMKPVHRASKQDLIRRATFDLTGLPPTAEEVNAFVRDSSPDAFARVVDRLLVSAQYGERWGRFWLGLLSQKCNYFSTGSGSRAQQ